MNKIYKSAVALLSLSLCSALLIGCDNYSDDQDFVLPKVVERTQSTTKTAITLSASELKAKVAGDVATVNITTGSGGYQVTSLDPSVAEASIQGNVISLKALQTGRTKLLISDQSGAVTTIPVNAYTKEQITLSKQSIELSGLLGYKASGIVLITDGNGEYEVTSNNNDVKATITNDSQINIESVARRDAYTATLTITDKSGFTQNLEVTVSSHTTPYSEERIQTILANKRTRFEANVLRQLSSTRISQILDGNIILGINFFDSNIIKIVYPAGDLSVGIKENAKITISKYGETINEDTPIKLEIIKNDGKNVWGIFTWEENGKLNYGYFCDRVF